jgi:hypothetical protein
VTAGARGSARLAASLLGLSLLAVSPDAEAFKYRRPNLVGPYTDRQLTNPVNAMTLLAGPGSSYTFGQRFDTRSLEAGLEYGRYALSTEPPSDAVVNEAWSRFGIAFGLLPHLDAGAVFLNFKYAPNFDFTEVLVYVTQSFELGDWELGVRLSFLTPGKPRGWQFNPGLLAVYRGGRTKFEAGLLLPFGAGSLLREPEDESAQYFGVNLPLRGTLNVTPALYLGLESGLLVPRVDLPERTALPLGALAGYTILAGNRLFDVSAGIKWDELVYLAPADGVDAAQFGSYRIDVGVTLHRMAVPPPK